jgi:hypothetical protein
MILRFLLLFCSLGLAGCDDFSYLMRKDGVLVLQPPAGSDPEQVLRILQGRFDAFRPSVFSRVEAKVDSGQMHFVFRRGSPEPPILGTLMMQRGVLTATLETGEILYTSGDIIDANTVLENGIVYLKLVVSDQAAARIGEATARNPGKVINVVLDGFTVFRSTISGPFSKHFQLSADYPFHEVRVIEALLEHGTLPGPVGFVSTSGLFEEAAN